MGRDLTAFVTTLEALCETVSGRPAPTPHAAGAGQPQGVFAESLAALAAGDCSTAVIDRLRAASVSLPPAVAEELGGILDRLSAARSRLTGLETGPPLPPAPPPARRLPPAGEPAADIPRGRTEVKSVRVDQRKLDEYLNLAGELVIARNTLVHAHKQFQEDRSAASGLKGAVDKLCRIVSDLQSNAMGMRMVPVRAVFQRFPRLVRDVARTLNKQIELVLEGEDTELDKQVAEGLSDPLVHLVRNAADHGIESPAARRAAGKPEAGTITLAAGREGNSILIEIRDDGGGIDPERLKEKGVAIGVLTPEQAASLSHDQALDLVFAAGLSTAKAVTDLSGRGVGMDVVRNNIMALGGAVAIRSEVGRGTTIRLSLPLTLAVTTVVLVEERGVTFALPIDAVQETLKVPPHDFRHLRGVQAVCPRGEIIPVRPLGGVIGLPPQESSPGRPSPLARVPVVVLSVGGERFGLAVDALHGQQEVVLKPVPPQFGHIDGLGGATILGDGSVVLVLDPRGLYRRCVSAPDDNT